MKERHEIEKKYKWNLQSIYNNMKDFQKDFELVKGKINIFDKYSDIMLNDGKSLYDTLDMTIQIERHLDKLYCYTSLNFDSDTRINNNQELKEKVLNLYDSYKEKSSFIVPTLLDISEKEIETLQREYPKLKDFENYINRIMRYKEYTLNKDEEKIVSILEKTNGNNYKTYELLKESDITYNDIEDENGNLVPFSDSVYGIYIESKDRNVRKNAFNEIYRVYRKYINTFASLLYGELVENSSIARLRKYDSSLQMSLYHDELNLNMYDNLINTVNENLDILQKYLKLKKKELKLKELHMYDIYVNMQYSFSKTFSFDDGFDIVKKALYPLGNEYIDILSTSFESGWLDIFPNNGKRTGGYSGGSYDTNPFILLNYLERYDDVSTLAHELGHSMHTYYCNKNNKYQDSGYSLFVAEVASIVNELLLSKYMLKHASLQEEKKYIIDNLLEMFRGTLFRQTMFAEFEKNIYELVDKDIVLTADILNEKYYKLNKKYYGDEIVIDEEIKYEWARVPHFYYNFYVYKYATGLSAACYLVENVILKGNYQQYLDFLKCGRTKNPIDSLKVAGVDMNDPNVIKSALNMFNELIDKYEENSLQ